MVPTLDLGRLGATEVPTTSGLSPSGDFAWGVSAAACSRGASVGASISGGGGGRVALTSVTESSSEPSPSPFRVKDCV